MYYEPANQTLTLSLNGLPVCYCDAWPAGPYVSLDAWPIKDNLHKQPIKDNLHNHVNIRSIILVYTAIAG
jgi:hypothetical protein